MLAALEKKKKKKNFTLKVNHMKMASTKFYKIKTYSKQKNKLEPN